MTAKLAGMARSLVANDLIDVDSISRANASAERQGISLLHYLVLNDILDQRVVAVSASKEFQLPLLEIDAFDPAYFPQNVIDAQIVSCHRVLPLSTRNKSLILAVSDPGNLNAINEVSFHSGLKIELVVTEDCKLTAAIEKYLERERRNYSAESKADGQLDDAIEIDAAASAASEEELNAFDETPLVRFINQLLLEAVALGASDIHFEPYESTYRVRFRIDGLLQEMTCPPVELSTRLASRIKIMAQLDIAEKRAPQDGRIRIRHSEIRIIDIRVSCLPTLWGEKIVMRILDPLRANLDIHTLGMEPGQEKLYLDALQKHQGLVLVTGPTGSGKSLTLYNGLNLLNASTRNISTVEDPVEITIEGINQLAVNTKTGLSFASALRALLRQDPDILMLGEVRDLETAEIALRAAQTGHLVLTTLHTLSAAASLTRLHNMGIPLYNLASTVSLVVAQRLARRLCESCKESIEIPEKVMIEQGFTPKLHPAPRLFRARGCKACRDGFQGRIGFYEVVPITEGLSRIIMEDGSAIQFRQYMQTQGLANLREAALSKVAQGLTSLDEANRLT